jgi:tRNA dimethylallyltransferase
LRESTGAVFAPDGLAALVARIDAETRARIDTLNPVRVQRAWEVQQATGHSLAWWQDNTPPPVLPLADCTALVMEVDKDRLNTRIETRFDRMIAAGALDEARAMRPQWNPAHLSAKAIGARELIAHLDGEIPLEEAATRSIIASRQYAKRQRTWFRSGMKHWEKVRPAMSE